MLKSFLILATIFSNSAVFAQVGMLDPAHRLKTNPELQQASKLCKDNMKNGVYEPNWITSCTAIDAKIKLEVDKLNIQKAADDKAFVDGIAKGK